MLSSFFLLRFFLYIHPSFFSVLLCTFSQTYHRNALFSCFKLSILISISICSFTFLFIHMLSVSFVRLTPLLPSLTVLCLLPLFFTQGAWCVPASCRECQQDVFCHHRPVEDQQHVPLQPRLFPAPLPEGSTDQEGDQAPQNSHTASVFLQRASSYSSYKTWIQNSTPHSWEQTVINCYS